MTTEEYKIEFQLLKDNLIDNYVIYHERVTLLLQLTLFEIQDTRVNFKAKIIKPLDKTRAEENNLYRNMISKNEISFGASYLFGKDDTSSLLKNKTLGRAYCPFTLWLDPELSKFALENDDEITKQIPKYILGNEDWKVLKINSLKINNNKMEENQSVQSILENKPVKPKIEEFNLTENGLIDLEKFKQSCKKKKEIILYAVFISFIIVGVLLIFALELNWFWLLAVVLCSAILTWGLTDRLIKAVSKYDLKDLLFEKQKSQSIDTLNKNNLNYEVAKASYVEKNDLFERVVRRSAWHYWQSLSALDFEDAVADMFEDKGWIVRKTAYKGDQGVDLFIEKDGTKGIVQCKTYKKVLGPNSVRDLYGTMVAQNATIAYLTAPGGFSQATKDFCRGKPITLLDIDGLTQMFYDFENYRPYWIDNATSIADLQKGINKMMGRGRRRY